ncbi:hypothetical protein KCP76_15475 [Salmonella enterica subsp. enterica serovar Weltevreden]|nr:hypothetical protein KCP76_15475 [Salmonella enterica subsp. enterica serovar Weltevreden]
MAETFDALAVFTDVHDAPPHVVDVGWVATVPETAQPQSAAPARTRRTSLSPLRRIPGTHMPQTGNSAPAATGISAVL